MFRVSATTATIAVATIAALNPASALAQTSPPSTSPPPPITAPQPPPPPPPPPPPVAVPQPPPTPPAPVPVLPPGPTKLAAKSADTNAMAASIVKSMTDKAFGWQFAIAQHGNYATSGSDGSARSAKDNKGQALKMKPTMRYEIASLTKNITAVATMKLLRLRGLNVNASIDEYLPADWKRGKGFKTKSVTFAQLLTHTSGILQATQTTACKDVCGNTWDGVKGHVAVGVIPNSSRVYKNANYALLRVLNAAMWKASGGKIYGFKTEYVESMNYKGDEIKKPVKVKVVLPVNADTNARYAMDFVDKRILTPAGIKNVTCTVSDQSTVGWNYLAGATESTSGQFMSWPSSECAGNAGLRLSSIEIVRYLAHLRHGKIIEAPDLATMDALRAGWREADNLGPGTPEPVRWHGGALKANKKTILHTCGITFPDGTEASIIINSDTTLNKCRVLRDAWIAAL